MITLGIETSCDETAVSLVRDGRFVLSSEIASQVARHAPFGGVVPEIAAREHVTHFVPVLERALKTANVALRDVALIAVTERPGLLAALLSGVAAAEALGVALEVPVIGVNHIEAHLSAPFLARGEIPQYPFVSLVVSGGHTHLFRSLAPADHRLLGATLDDAAGEAFDKVAKVLGLGYPGGPAIQKAAESGQPQAVPLKRPLLPGTLDFSFSGLKTAVLYSCFGQDASGRPRSELRSGLTVENVAASFQAAVVDVLVTKARWALELTGLTRLAVGGGVACNRPLREALRRMAEEQKVELWHAPPSLCTDNAAMIAARGQELWSHGLGKSPTLSARATWVRDAG